jgi:hypothetical protein
MNRTSRRSAVQVLICGLGAASVLFGAWAISRRPSTDHPFEQAVGGLKSRNLGTGFHQGVALPAEFHSLTKDGTVDLVRTADGRWIVLFKTSAGWKGDYSGFLVSDAPLEPGEVGRDAYGRPAITIRGLESVIRRKIDDWHYEVFSDLG